jgi:hypothetical protein
VECPEFKPQYRKKKLLAGLVMQFSGRAPWLRNPSTSKKKQIKLSWI